MPIAYHFKRKRDAQSMAKSKRREGYKVVISKLKKTSGGYDWAVYLYKVK